MATASATESRDATEATACTCRTQPLMPVPDAARMLARSREYLYLGLREGRFPGARFGRSWGMPRAFVEGFIRAVERGQQLDFDEYASAWLAAGEAEQAA